MLIKLRDYQNDGVEKIRGAFRAGFKAPLYVLPTGGGKTIIFCYITEQAIKRGNSVLILVHRAELLKQTSKKLTEIGVPHGLIAPGYSETGNKIQVASVQTIVRRLGRGQKYNLIIIDECHHANAGSWRKIILAYPKARLIGVTATPCRLDGSGLGIKSGGFFDVLIEGPNIIDLISAGHLSPPIVYAPPAGISTDGVKIKMGEYDKKEIAKRVDKPKITGCAVSHYQRLCPGVPAIYFCCSVGHAVNVAESFNAAGIPAAHLSGDLPSSVREYRVAGLGSGIYKILTSCDVVSEGTDIPIVGAIGSLRPSASRGLVLQQWGRGLRPYPGKDHAIILDHAGNCVRHKMLPDSIQKWSLEATPKRVKQAADEADAIRQCKFCYAIYPSFMSTCPQCGAEATKTPREIEQVEGELKRIEEIEKKKEIWKADSIEEFIDIGKNRGYAPGWAYIAYNIRKNKKRK